MKKRIRNMSKLSDSTEHGVEPAVSEPVRRERKQRPFLFWLGLVFAGAGLSMTSFWFPLGLIKNTSEYWAPCLLSMPVILPGILFIALSRRKIRHVWFWVGMILFALGLGGIPGWICNWQSWMTDNWERWSLDSGIYHTSICVCSIMAVVGVVCLWKGWPRKGVSEPQSEAFGLIAFSSLSCAAISFACRADADGPISANPAGVWMLAAYCMTVLVITLIVGLLAIRIQNTRRIRPFKLQMEKWRKEGYDVSHLEDLLK